MILYRGCIHCECGHDLHVETVFQSVTCIYCGKEHNVVHMEVRMEVPTDAPGLRD